MTKRVAVVQSSYIPWKGYFDLIRQVDEFVLYDDAQFTRRDWRNRNQIKTRDGLKWLTIPVEVKGKYLQAIKDVRIADPRWAEHHLKTMTAAYARAPHFKACREALATVYAGATSPWLSDVNRHLLAELCGLLGIDTRLTSSMDYVLPEGRVERLIALCQRTGATSYLSGPSARAYLNGHDEFAKAGIDVAFIDYGRYPEYEQLYPPFRHQVSIVDLIFSVGTAARDYVASDSSR